MAQNNDNQDFTNNADGASLGGGTVKRFLNWIGANITLTGSGTNTYTMPASSDTLVGRASTDTITGAKTWADGTDIIFGTTTGTKLGTGVTQKIGFFNQAPNVQPSATTDLGSVLSVLGLRANGTAYPITTSGTLTLTGLIKFTPPVSTSATGNVATTTRYELITTGASVITRTLYTPVGNAGAEVHLQKIDSGAGTVTVATAAGSILGGGTSLSVQFKHATYFSDGTNWYVMDNN